MFFVFLLMFGFNFIEFDILDILHYVVSVALNTLLQQIGIKLNKIEFYVISC